MDVTPLGGDGAHQCCGGQFTGNLYLDSGELLGVVRGEIDHYDRQLTRKLKAGTGRGTGAVPR